MRLFQALQPMGLRWSCQPARRLFRQAQEAVPMSYPQRLSSAALLQLSLGVSADGIEQAIPSSAAVCFNEDEREGNQTGKRRQQIARAVRLDRADGFGLLERPSARENGATV